MSDKQLPVLNVQPAKHTFCAYNNTYVLKGPHSFFMDGLKPDSSIISKRVSTEKCARACVRVCVRACVCACVRACVCVSTLNTGLQY